MSEPIFLLSFLSFYFFPPSRVHGIRLRIPLRFPASRATINNRVRFEERLMTRESENNERAAPRYLRNVAEESALRTKGRTRIPRRTVRREESDSALISSPSLALFASRSFLGARHLPLFKELFFSITSRDANVRCCCTKLRRSLDRCAEIH